MINGGLYQQAQFPIFVILLAISYLTITLLVDREPSARSTTFT